MALTRKLKSYELPFPSIYNPDTVGDFFTPNYNEVMAAAVAWRKTHNIQPRRKDRNVVGYTAIDLQRTFCLEHGELSMAPASINDTRQATEFLYRNLRIISNLTATLDSHFLLQVFHPPFWLKENGDFVDPFTQITSADVKTTKYRPNPEMAYIIWGDMKYLPLLNDYALAYTEKLEQLGKPLLVVWPCHGLFGSPGHALVPAFHTACQIHELSRWSRTEYRLKGSLALSEHYSPYGTEVVTLPLGGNAQYPVGELSDDAIDDLLKNEVNIIAGEASSHCVAMAIYDILRRIKAQDPKLAEKVYILKDCTSPVAGFEAQAKKAMADFAAAGMHLVDSTTPMDEWPGINPEIFQL